MKVWLDDDRPEPEGWVRARTVTEAITLLQTGGIDEISLDHDLGDDAAGTGYDVLTWIERAVAGRGFVPPAIDIHTANPPARIRMLAAVDAIGRAAATQLDADTPAKRLAALPPGYVDAVVVKCREALGDALQEVILYGSRAYGNPTPNSDVDIALIVTKETWPDGKDEFTLQRDINLISQAGLDTQIYVETREELESYRGVAISMQAQILERGIRLFVSDCIPAPVKMMEPKTHLAIAQRWLKLAGRRIRYMETEVAFCGSEKEKFKPSVIDTEYLFMAACWSFKSMLFARGISCVDRHLRWNLVRLQRLAALLEPELQPLSADIESLPWYYDQYRYGYLNDVPDERTQDEFQAALAAAQRIYAKCAAAIERLAERFEAAR